MAKKKIVNPIIAFLDNGIARAEKQLLDHNGTVPFDFDRLERYHKLRKWYSEPKIIMIEPPKKGKKPKKPVPPPAPEEQEESADEEEEAEE